MGKTRVGKAKHPSACMQAGFGGGQDGAMLQHLLMLTRDRMHVGQDRLDPQTLEFT